MATRKNTLSCLLLFNTTCIITAIDLEITWLSRSLTHFMFEKLCDRPGSNPRNYLGLTVNTHLKLNSLGRGTAWSRRPVYKSWRVRKPNFVTETIEFRWPKLARGAPVWKTRNDAESWGLSELLHTRANAVWVKFGKKTMSKDHVLVLTEWEWDLRGNH